MHVGCRRLHAFLDPSEEPDHGNEVPLIIGVGVIEIDLPHIRARFVSLEKLGELAVILSVSVDVVLILTSRSLAFMGRDLAIALRDKTDTQSDLLKLPR